MKKHIIFLLMLSVSFTAVLSQTTDEREANVEKTTGLLALQVGIPTKDMQAAIKNNMGNIGFGGALMVLSNPFSWGANKRNSPLRIGAELGYNYYGRFHSDVNVNGYRGYYKTSYGIMQANAVIHLQPSEPGPVRPFIEVLVGGVFYLSSIKEDLSAIESALGIDNFEMDSYASAGFNKGIAVGCSFGRKKRHNDGRFTLRGSYNRGSNIKYIVRNSLEYNPASGNLEYTVGKAPVSYFHVQIGIGF